MACLLLHTDSCRRFKQQLEKFGGLETALILTSPVNVAATRAKYRLYIIGDKEVWKNNKYVNKAREIIEQ